MADYPAACTVIKAGRSLRRKAGTQVFARSQRGNVTLSRAVDGHSCGAAGRPHEGAPARGA
jgi:hypothetical protein